MTDNGHRAPTRQRWTLVAVCLAGMLVGLDGMALTIAAPAIAQDVGTSFADLQWLANAYLLALAVALFPAGRLADRVGRKKMFVVGVGGFGLVSLALALSSSVWLLIVLRAAQGVAGAALQTSGQAMLRATFPKERLAIVLGIFGAASMLAVASGPMIGGFLVDHFDWRAIFEINIPVAVIAVLIVLFASRESRSRPSGGIHRDLRQLLGARPVAVGAAVTGFAHLGLFGFLFVFTLYLQNLKGIAPATAGLWLLPVTGTLVVSAPLGGVLTARWGPRIPMAAGMMLVAAGLAGFSLLDADATIAQEMAPAILLGLGAGMGLVAATEAIMANSPVEHAGLASALQQGMTQLGGVVGIAVLGGVLSWRAMDALGGDDAVLADQVAQGKVDSPTGMDAFLDGFQVALLVGAAAAVVAALVALLAPRRSVTGSGRDVAADVPTGAAP